MCADNKEAAENQRGIAPVVSVESPAAAAAAAAASAAAAAVAVGSGETAGKSLALAPPPLLPSSSLAALPSTRRAGRQAAAACCSCAPLPSIQAGRSRSSQRAAAAGRERERVWVCGAAVAGFVCCDGACGTPLRLLALVRACVSGLLEGQLCWRRRCSFVRSLAYSRWHRELLGRRRRRRLRHATLPVCAQKAHSKRTLGGTETHRLCGTAAATAAAATGGCRLVRLSAV